MTEKTCATCRFKDGGRCRRNPPQVYTQLTRDHNDELTSNYETTWPEVSDFDWCGEWGER